MQVNLYLLVIPELLPIYENAIEQIIVRVSMNFVTYVLIFRLFLKILNIKYRQVKVDIENIKAPVPFCRIGNGSSQK